MKKISIRSTLVLSSLAIVAIAFLVLVESTKKEQTQPYFHEKMNAAKLMSDCVSFLKEKNFKDEITVDNINDPNDTKLIGTRYSSITSGRGSLPVKLSTFNPNFAALVVELFHDLNLKQGDHICIGATGSFPALNIAVCSAAEVMKLKVSYIASVTSSSWGANNPEYTYLDMHADLLEENLFMNKIIASSIGANQDIGRSISPEGRSLAREAIDRNNVIYINGKSLNENIKHRMDIFKKREADLGKIKVYVNIGGGVASFGGVDNSNNLPNVLDKIKLDVFTDKTGVIFEMASNKVPFINLKNLQTLMSKYGLPIDPVPLPAIGEGKLFYDLKYDLRYVYGATMLLAFIIFALIVFDRKQNAIGNEIV